MSESIVEPIRVSSITGVIEKRVTYIARLRVSNRWDSISAKKPA